MRVTVPRGGMQTTVQDLGRRGYRSSGVPLSGAMDPFALRMANSLVGNLEGAAALEFTLVGPQLVFSDDSLVAVGGAECEGVSSWRPVEVKAGEILNLGRFVRGCRGYLAVDGGFHVPSVLGSSSTYLRGGWGGFEGRALRDGDQLTLGESLHLEASRAKRFAWRIDPRILPAYSSAPVVRAIRGAANHVAEIFGPEFKITPQSDRMGIRLSGDAISAAAAANQWSSAVAPGTVQLPPDGQPVILMADAQTIGGYPQIAHVIAMDLPLVAQLRPGDSIRFTEVSLADAHRIALVRAHSIAMLREGLAQKLE